MSELTNDEKLKIVERLMSTEEGREILINIVKENGGDLEAFQMAILESMILCSVELSQS